MTGDIAFWLSAGIHARAIWNIEVDSAHIVKIPSEMRNLVVAVPLRPSWYRDESPDWLRQEYDTYAEEQIGLQEFRDARGRSIWMGYGPRSNTVAFWVPEKGTLP